MKINSDVLTENEKKFFIDKILTHYHERDAKYFIEQFECFPDDYLKQDFTRIDNGFAVLNGNANVMVMGRFYVIKNNDFYRVSTVSKDSDSFDSGTRISTIQINGFEKVTDKSIWSEFEKINQFFLQIKNSI
ncbi:hypothetical protein [Psychrobacter nivimaris]|uniref:hypothetical protein n=1 Tax=Psychrobacter nivimaris TaxID=281738 RepID=UPI003736CB9A